MANKKGVAERMAVRKEREAQAGGKGYSEEDVQTLRKLLADRCAYCDVQLNGKGHVDHKTPIAQGGRNEPANLTLCCEKCNLAKHAKDVNQFLLWRLQHGLKNRIPRVV
jgi:5-methylcytosine-specific restriction endonuclease McrA